MTNKEREIIKEAAAIIAKEVRTNKVIIRGFGTFKFVHKPARTCRNPATGEPVEVDAKSVIQFKAN